MRISSYVALVILSLSLVGCARQDPTRNDLKSPCASYDNGSATTPCVKRSPLENNVA